MCRHEHIASCTLECCAGNWAKQVIFVCMANYRFASGSPAERALTGASLFFWCGSLKTAVVREYKCEIERKEMGFGSAEAVWMWSREAKQQTHPEFKWIFRKGNEKPQSIYITEETFVISFCSAFVSFTSHCLTATCFHPSRQNTAVFSTKINLQYSICVSLCMCIFHF